MPQPLAREHANPGLASTDGVASLLDPSLAYLGRDAISVAHAGFPRVDVAQGTVAIVSGTAALCGDPGTPPLFCNAHEDAINVPTPWIGGLVGSAQWLDPRDPGREWFAAGKARVSRQCALAPCGWSDQWCAPLWLEEGDAPSGDERPPGWEIVRLATTPPNASAADLDLRFWSIASPVDALGNAGRNYLGALADPRAESGIAGGELLHLFRGAIAN